ncbi:MAG: hypothetical protein A2660_01735 [Candidatus Doudnabacteria bacterium RIFCSPHIGHO2_01_FULL_45_18]|uniref:Uncharacterized protein n=1 Tax=Candidatus Doudnabacteria bacterium RIFCSPHIGHO2_01_FULL_45_18 TaxID=1817823 RepID=A0A1F5NR65_9BACT|nr:MAG: hypothetical protein A2660_01735 [Candidatus Doudnabacteria bacterium RIFCSPHIGHO2_01_FULL_45_18]
MFLRKKIRSKLIWLAVIVLLFLYWRGVKSALVEERGWNCQYHLVYAVCQANNNKAQMPGLWEIIKAGARF